MKYLIGLLLLANGLAAQAPLQKGDRVMLRTGPGYPYSVFGIVQAAGADSATVLLRDRCADIEQRTVAYSQLMIRVPAGRMTVPYTIIGAVNAFMFGKVAAHVVLHNGGGTEGARTARYGAALIIPFSALTGYEKRVGRWIPVLDLKPGMERLPVAPEDRYLPPRCSPSRPPLVGSR